jgi:hypothetical protein
MPAPPQVASAPAAPDAAVADAPAVAAPDRPPQPDRTPEGSQSSTNRNPVQTALSHPVANPATHALAPNASPSQRPNAQSVPNPNADAATFPITISVSPGEDISSIAEEIYGFANDELFELIQKSNPQIQDLKKIKIGDRIILPALPPAFDKFLGAG